MYRGRREKKEYKGAVPIGGLFEKYRTRLRPPQGVVVTAFCAVVETELGVSLTPSQVRYSVGSRTVSVTTGGPQKSEILFNKVRILKKCEEVLGAQGAPQHVV